jgi:hypothetical protein
VTTPLTIASVIALGLSGGFGSAWYMLTRADPPGAIQAGAWITWPRQGAMDADPYSRALIARQGLLPLGLGEGLVLIARVDDDGHSLRGGCSYRVAGRLPPARAWTLTLTDRTGRLPLVETAAAQPPPLPRTGFTSAEVLRDEAGRISINVAPTLVSGDWLPAPARGQFQLVLRLYDSPVAGSATALDRAALPTLIRTGCG